ncbi:hypothetical protein jhhlp_002170 [Lomentospora prolificans]|uniref:Uncharacterized protein n=1 Tax=Lomentospora prolificans TaxID=41688 RepID=A0A2N3NDC1_9PEZI|nr:hypothetical protein jhhlp_002170 [Lomentospora prolificans]
MENICNPTVAPQHDGGYPSNQARPRVIPPVVRRLRSNRALAPQRPVTAIAVHAGAGFHSHANEAFHLQACNDAARMAMKFLNAGASATEAVTIAVKVLEDLEITNAGYGSNLCIDGTVECDASIVDYLGRSGACGAVPSLFFTSLLILWNNANTCPNPPIDIRNPICLAKTLLDKSLEPLSLRRVPPSFLVGQGAVKFARDHGFEILPNENLISKNARERFHRWQHDLRRVAATSMSTPTAQSLGHSDSVNTIAERAKTAPSSPAGASQPDHKTAWVNGLFNEAQPDSPPRGSRTTETTASSSRGGYPRVGRTMDCSSEQKEGSQDAEFASARLSDGSTSSQFLVLTDNIGRNSDTLELSVPQHDSRYSEDSKTTWSQQLESEESVSDVRGLRDGPTLPDYPDQQPPGGVPSDGEQHMHSSALPTGEGWPAAGHKRFFSEYAEGSEDIISDTVGAIAIDSMGRIAAGSSSGGIGMKHRGRVGPAALVRVGSAVIPAHPGDPSGISVAAVASGTGEHIATTMASQRCAERLMRGSRQGDFGEDVYDGDDHDIVHSFIQEDFMKHPGVQGMTTTGALGIIAVKMSRTAYYFYFGHNTESFALATMSSTDRDPHCLMSRLNPDGETKISVGARRVKRQ